MTNASENILFRIAVIIKVLQVKKPIWNQSGMAVHWKKMVLICNVCISKEKYRKNLKKPGNCFFKKRY